MDDRRQPGGATIVATARPLNRVQPLLTSIYYNRYVRRRARGGGRMPPCLLSVAA